MWFPKWLTKLGSNTKYMQGNIRYMYSLEIVIVARSLRSLVKIESYLKTDPTRSQIWNKSSHYRITVASGIGFRLGYSFRVNAASEVRVNVCHKPTVRRIGTLLYSRQPEEPEVYNELPTDKSLQFINSFTEIVIFPHSTVQHDVRNRSQNYVITGNIYKVI